MPAEVKKEIQLEIAHVLFIDIVGYSKLSINEQHAAVDELNAVVRTSEQLQKAEALDRLIKIPTGDGMALVFYTSLEAPAQCAVEISRALKEHPRLETSDGGTQRSGERRDRCKPSRQSRRCRSQHSAAGDGLRGCRAHSAFQACRRGSRRIRTVAAAPARSWRLRSEAWDARHHREPLRGSSGQSATAEKVPSSEEAQNANALGGHHSRVAHPRGYRRCRRNVFP